MSNLKTQFSDVRRWGAMRGIDGAEFQTQFQRVLQEIIEIHEAFIEGDMEEVSDAIGDSLVTLVNLGVTVNMKSEDCLDGAFNIIKLRKGITRNGDFIRYGKLNDDEKARCDAAQGNPGSEYFAPEQFDTLTKADFEI